MVKFQFYEPVSSFASATQAKAVTRSTVLRPVRLGFETEIEMIYCRLNLGKKSLKIYKTPLRRLSSEKVKLPSEQSAKM